MTEFNANEELMKRLKQRAEFGAEKYGRPLGTWDGRNTIIDAIEEALDLAVYLTKLNEERGEAVRYMRSVAKHLEGGMLIKSSYEVLVDGLRTCADRLDADIPRIGDENYVPAMTRLEQMSGADKALNDLRTASQPLGRPEIRLVHDDDCPICKPL